MLRRSIPAFASSHLLIALFGDSDKKKEHSAWGRMIAKAGDVVVALPEFRNSVVLRNGQDCQSYLRLSIMF